MDAVTSTCFSVTSHANHEQPGSYYLPCMYLIYCSIPDFRKSGFRTIKPKGKNFIKQSTVYVQFIFPGSTDSIHFQSYVGQYLLPHHYNEFSSYISNSYILWDILYPIL